MLTDFLYKMKDDVYGNISDQEAKNRTIKSKQMLLKGVMFGDIKRIANDIQNTDGLSEAINQISAYGIHQVGFSDGFGPFVAYRLMLMALFLQN